MLGTAIIAAALATGDTMSAHDPLVGCRRRSGRPTSSSRRQRREARPPAADAGAATGVRYFPQATPTAVRRTPSRARPRRRRRAGDRRAGRRPGRDQPPDRAAGDAVRQRPAPAARASARSTPKAAAAVSLARPAPGRGVSEPKAADRARRRAGDTIRVFAGRRSTAAMRVQGDRQLRRRRHRRRRPADAARRRPAAARPARPDQVRARVQPRRRRSVRA